jgi:hypothetical protein
VDVLDISDFPGLCADKPKDLDQGKKSPARPAFGRTGRTKRSNRMGFISAADIVRIVA